MDACTLCWTLLEESHPVPADPDSLAYTLASRSETEDTSHPSSRTEQAFNSEANES